MPRRLDLDEEPLPSSIVLRGADGVRHVVAVNAAGHLALDGHEITGDGEGGATPGASIVRKFPFAFDTPGMLTGAALYTPTVGDWFFDAWLYIETGWDGTNPRGDFGQFRDLNLGLIRRINGAVTDAWDMTQSSASIDGMEFSLLSYSEIAKLYQQVFYSSIAGASIVVSNLSGDLTFTPWRFTTADPIKVCVSQDGTITGADPGSTVGSAILYLVTATPA